MQHHRNAVTDEQQIDMRVEQPGDRIGVSGETDDGLLALAGQQSGGRDAARSRRRVGSHVFSSLDVSGQGRSVSPVRARVL
jgi:hypothetical protein